jgi:predicted DNA-binding protein (MmcQ/YjbR family)
MALPGVTLEHPWGDDIYKVGGKMFLGTSARENASVSLQVSDIAFEALTETGQAIPAPYMARAKWVHFATLDDLASAGGADLIRNAHALTALKLTKKAQRELGLLYSSSIRLCTEVSRIRIATRRAARATALM